jgi:ribosomal protein L21E
MGKGDNRKTRKMIQKKAQKRKKEAFKKTLPK